MRISEALRQLRTADKGLSADQIIDIDFLTEFPIVEDPELKKPMLFYCPSGEWHHVSGIVGKRYRQALQTSDILDDDLGTCRQQIKLFESAYFKDTRSSVLDDPRLGRIPLINFLRYYAYWLILAIKSGGKHFSYAMVVDDFRIHLDSVLYQYENVLKYLDKKLVVAAAAEDVSQVFTYIELFQKMVAIPIAVIDESKRAGIAEVLKESTRIESEIEHRIANEFPMVTATLLKAIKDFPNVESDEFPSTYDWVDVLRIETVHSEMVTEYIRACQAFQSLNGLILEKQSDNWSVSSDKYFDAAFNATVTRDVVAHVSMSEAKTTNKSESRFLFPLNMTGWEPDALLPELDRFVNEIPFRDSVSHQIALVHLFLPFYVANLQTNQSGLVRTEFVKAAQVLKSCLAALPMRSADELRSLVVRCETTWQDWDIPIGIAYSVFDNTGKELLLGSTHDAVRLLTVHCGNGREKMLNYLGRSKLHELYADSAEKLKAVAHNDFAREHYEKYGFIVTEVLVDEDLLLSETSAQSGTNVFMPDQIQIPANMATGWGDYHDRYSRLIGESVLSDIASKFIDKMARKLAKRIKDVGFPEKDPIRNYTSPDVPKGLAGHGDIIDVLIQRRAVLRWAQVCELRRVDKAKSQNRKRFFQQMGYGTGNLESYSNYFNAIGLKLENLYAPDESGFFPEELTWLASFRTRK